MPDPFANTQMMDEVNILNYLCPRAEKSLEEIVRQRFQEGIKVFEKRSSERIR